MNKRNSDSSLYRKYDKLNLVETADHILKFWKENQIFRKSIQNRPEHNAFIFYEGPPSANGMPGIHHVLGRTIKDIFCRYKTLKGYRVERKSGWDTHGLPVELQVEKRLGLRKDDIGKKISIADYNKECREDVMKYQDVWADLTDKQGYWIDLDNPYITYKKEYIESLWQLLKRLYDKDLLYQGYTIQPYSPAAGTGLSSHELNQPGTYREVKDVSCVAQFKKIAEENTYFLAWTTTPWTLPSNTALAVGKDINYVKIETFNPYTHQQIQVILAEAALSRYFNAELENSDNKDYEHNGKNLPWRKLDSYKGSELAGQHYHQLLPYVQPSGDAFRVIVGDFVTTTDGTGIVHIAPTFGADDMRVAKQNNVPALTVTDPDNVGKQIPLVDKSGKFVPEVIDFAGRYVKDYRDEEQYKDVNVDIIIKLKKENKCFKSEKYEHNYPHCWRTDKPILYYPLEAWFIKTTAYRDRMVELNNTIQWKPESTGTGRFANWLENLVDWNLSRSRYWGTPLPLWLTEDGSEIKCIGSIEELRVEVNKAQQAGLMPGSGLPEGFDLHRPYVDELILISESGKPMHRTPDVVDVWFDSGAMPYAQWHYPFENEDKFKANFPADFIAEGVDQTRGWFFTLHALSVMLFDSVAYKTVVSNGLVLDKEGVKMSKRLGNVIDPFETLNKYGPDATRLYMVANAQPWDNLKFDIDGIDEVRKKFFGTLYNTYSFFSLYAEIDQFKWQENTVAIIDRPEMDRWIYSLLQTLIIDVENSYESYEPTRAARSLIDFVNDHLSNWYVRLGRRRFWKGEMSLDKLSAYQTLYECLETISILLSPIAPFYADSLFQDLNNATKRLPQESVHLVDFPKVNEDATDKELERRMQIAQDATSMILSLRKQAKLKVRQPLQKVMVPILNDDLLPVWNAISELIKSEVNVKEIQLLTGEETRQLIKAIKPDFKALGPKYGKNMKAVQQAVLAMTQDEIQQLEAENNITVNYEGNEYVIESEDVEISSQDIPGWLVSSANGLTIALDVTLSDDLVQEGLARELVNRIQTLRKSSGYDVTDKINVNIKAPSSIIDAGKIFESYICSETLSKSLLFVDLDELLLTSEIEINGIPLVIQINKVIN